MSEDSKDEYDYLKSMMERYELLNLWSYRLVQCSPLKTGRTGVYSTNKTPVAALTSYGEVQMDRMEKKFDDQGQPVSNPSARLLKRHLSLERKRKAEFSSPPISMAASRA